MSDTIFSDVFRKLNAHGILSREKYHNHSSAFDRICDEISALHDNLIPVRGCLYYTTEDAAEYEIGGKCQMTFLTYVPSVDGRLGDVRYYQVDLGRTIRGFMQSAGFDVEWDETADTDVMTVIPRQKAC